MRFMTNRSIPGLIEYTIKCTVFIGEFLVVAKFQFVPVSFRCQFLRNAEVDSQFSNGVAQSVTTRNNDGNAVPAAQADPAWKRNIGNGAPKHFLSWSNTFTWRNWDLSTLMRGAFGYKIFNMRRYGMGLKGCGTDNVLASAYTDYSEVNAGGSIISSYFLEKGDYFKLDNVTLGYTFIPQKRNLLESLRVYLSAKNLFTLTGYKGNDPSIVTSTGITPGIDSNSAYPQAFQFTLGVTVRFH